MVFFLIMNHHIYVIPSYVFIIRFLKKISYAHLNEHRYSHIRCSGMSWHAWIPHQCSPTYWLIICEKKFSFFFFLWYLYVHLLSTSLVRLLVLTVCLLCTSTCYSCQLFLILTSLISYSEGRRRKWVFPALKVEFCKLNYVLQ